MHLRNQEKPDFNTIVWFINLNHISDFNFTPYLYLLDDSESKKYNNFRFENDRKHYAISHIMTRIILSNVTHMNASEIEYQITKYGKPVLKAGIKPAIHFNLTHTKNAAACILSRNGNVGIDMESISEVKDIELLSRTCLTPKEQQFLINLDYNVEFFLKLWTLKEAYMKATGRGLQIPPQQIEFKPQSLLNNQPQLADVQTEKWHFHLLNTTQDTITAICTSSRSVIKPVITNVTDSFKNLCQEAK